MITDKEGVEKLQQAIDESSYIVFFGGAGVSTESGIPDFRSQDGLYSQKYKYPPEEIVSHTFLVYKTEDFFEFYRIKCLRLMQSLMRLIRSWRKWSRQASLRLSSHRISTVCIRRREARKCLSFMDPP